MRWQRFPVSLWPMGLSMLSLLAGYGRCGFAITQDANYWTNQYGNRARLLAGAVVGSSDDLAAVFYNPGALALVSNPELLLAGNVVEHISYKLEVAGAPASDIGDSRFGGAPSLFAGEVRFPFLGESRLGYSFLTRYKADIRIVERFGAAGPVESPVANQIRGRLSLEEKLTETWVGLTWARRLSAHWAVGVSPFLTIRSQRFDQELLAEGVDSAGAGAITLRGSSVSFGNWRVLAKLGVSVRYDPWRFGLTLTTPSLSIWGQGSGAVDRTFIASGETDEVLGFVVEDVAADYRSPASVAAGGSYRWNKTALHVSAEYFGALERGQVLDVEPATGGADAAPAVGLVQELDDVVNFAVGVEQALSLRLEVYAGFNTDFSGKPVGATDVFPLSSWDIYHGSVGASFGLGRSEFTLGGVVSWGRGESRMVEGTGIAEIDEVLDLPTTTRVKYLRLTGIIGFTILFE